MSHQYFGSFIPSMPQTLILLLFLYILEGIPQGLQSRFLSLLLRSKGLSLTALGFYKLLYIPWLCKSFYAPLVDTCLTKRLWLIISLSGLLSVSVTFSSTQVVPQSSEQGEGDISVFPLVSCLFFYNLFAATQDIAVDGLALLILSANQLSAGNTIQVVGYKIGAVLGGGLLTTLVAYIPFSRLFWFVSAIYAIGIVVCSTSTTLGALEDHFETIQEVPSEKRKNTIASNGTNRVEHDTFKNHHTMGYLQTLKVSVINSKGSRRLIALLLLYKLGEQGAMNMLPLLLFDRGASVAKVGFWTGLVGQVLSLSGSTAAYRFMSKGKSTVDALTQLFIVRALLQSPLVLIAVESVGRAIPNLSFAVGAFCMNVTLFVSGAITTVMFTLMMQCTRAESDVRTQATHFTILSTAELLGKLVFTVIANPLTDLFGYAIANGMFLFLSILPVWLTLANRRHFDFVDNREFKAHQQ